MAYCPQVQKEGKRFRYLLASSLPYSAVSTLWSALPDSTWLSARLFAPHVVLGPPTN